MQPIRPIRLTARLIALAFLWLLTTLTGTAAFAQDDDGILPVTEAYKLSTDTTTPGVLKLHWDIAPDYYLYRGRMKVTGADGVTPGDATLPDGEKHHDEYLGDVEIYHHAVDATLPYTVAPGTQRLKLAVRYQGCHEVEPRICYPPHTEHLDLPLPAGAPQAGTGTPASLGAALAQIGTPSASATPGTDTAPLPAEQAFRFEALASSPTQLLLRWTMPKGYYLYRDQTVLRLKDAAGLSLGKPQWPQGVTKQDPHFGNVVVYFDQVELPVAIEGDTSKIKQLALEASFQGCQDGGLCYPLMTRAVSVDLAGGATATATGETVAGPAPETRPASAPSAALDVSLWSALLLALGGGLVLNLMPCVLPVLSIKAVGLIESGENSARRRRHALAYTAGVLISFVALGLIILSLKAAWGAQLQKPLVVAVLALVMLAVALSMSGVVQFGASLGNAGSGLAAVPGWPAISLPACLRWWWPAPAPPRSWERRWPTRWPRRPCMRCWCSACSAWDWRCRSWRSASCRPWPACCRGPAPGWTRSSRCWPSPCTWPPRGWPGCWPTSAAPMRWVCCWRPA